MDPRNIPDADNPRQWRIGGYTVQQQVGDRSNFTVTKFGHYVVGGKLGAGTFGTVKMGRHDTTGQEVVMKILNKNKMKKFDAVKECRNEIVNIHKFRHPHIIRLYEVMYNPLHIIMIFEYAPQGDLYSYMMAKKILEQQEAQRFFRQIISGVDFCHRQMIVHRDVRPENILLDKNKNVKLANFGFSKLMEGGEFLNTCCGSLHYTAPEILSSQPYVGPQVDVWSCGVILYAFLCSKLPFSVEDKNKLCARIKSGVFSIPLSVDLSLQKYVRSMMQTDPKKRATLDEVKSHEWFQKDLQKARIISGDPDDQLSEARDKEVGDEAKYKQDESDASRKSPEINGSEKYNGSANALYISTKDTFMISANCSDTEQRSILRLGLRPTLQEPVMLEVYSALKALDYEWAVLDPFHLIVRKYNATTKKYVKLSLQLYRTNSDEHVLDLKSDRYYIGPPQSEQVSAAGTNQPGSRAMDFLEMCLAISRKLGR